MNPEKTFEITFNYPLSNDLQIRLNALVELHHSDPFYIISGFHLRQHNSQRPLLPDIKIQALQTPDGVSWVHADSQQESLLSDAAGKAIEALGDIEISTGSKF